MIMRTGQIGHHEITLRVGQHEHEIKQTMRFTLDTIASCFEFVGTRLPSLLANKTTGKVFEGWMFLRTQEQGTTIGANVRVYIKGVNEGVESVGHEERIKVPSAADAEQRRRRVAAVEGRSRPLRDLP